MKKSIKQAVWLRVAAAMVFLLIFSAAVSIGIIGIQDADQQSADAYGVLSQAQSAEVAHYKWSIGLSKTLYEGVSFTGSTDATSCALGKWLAEDLGFEDEEILRLRSELEPLHKNLHESAKHALTLMETDLDAAQNYYNQTIQTNVDNVVQKLGQILSRAEKITQNGEVQKAGAIRTIQIVMMVCFLLSLFALVSLTWYVLRHVVHPILSFTKECAPLNDGQVIIQTMKSARWWIAWTAP